MLGRPLMDHLYSYVVCVCFSPALLSGLCKVAEFQLQPSNLNVVVDRRAASQGEERLERRGTHEVTGVLMAPSCNLQIYTM